MFKNPKLHKGVKPADYHAWNGATQRGAADYVISRSELVNLLECGELFLAGGRKIESDNESVTLGSLVDVMLLTPELFDSTFIVRPETYLKTTTKGRGDKKETVCSQAKWNLSSNTCKQWEAEAVEKGLQPITAKMHKKATRMMEAITGKEVNGINLGDLIAKCETQTVVTADWRDDETGLNIPCRAMLDMARTGDPVIAYDLKTAREVDDRSFFYSIRSHGYDIQAWMYSEMLSAATEGDHVPFGFICVRNTWPFCVATYRAKQSILSGEERFRAAMREYCDSLQSGEWSGYTEGFEPI